MRLRCVVRSADHLKDKVDIENRVRLVMQQVLHRDVVALAKLLEEAE